MGNCIHPVEIILGN